MKDGVAVKIKMKCNSLFSNTYWSESENKLVTEFSVTLRCGLGSNCRGGIQIDFDNEQDQLRFTPGLEYEFIEIPPAEPELNDDGIVGMYTDQPQPIESAGGGVQQYDTANQITVTVDDSLNVIKTETSGPTIAERLAFSGINPADMNVDADE